VTLNLAETSVVNRVGLIYITDIYGIYNGYFRLVCSLISLAQMLKLQCSLVQLQAGGKGGRSEHTKLTSKHNHNVSH